MSRFPTFFAIAVVLAMAGCTVHQDTVPSPTGPSDIAAPLADKPTPLFTITPRPVTLKIPAIFNVTRATTFKGVLVVTDDIGQQAFAPIEVAIGVPTTTTP